jgi:hypothetical protein
LNGLAPQVEPLAVTGNKLGLEVLRESRSPSPARGRVRKGLRVPEVVPVACPIHPVAIKRVRERVFLILERVHELT